MTSLEMLIKGLLAGLAIAIPVGPVNVMCVSRTLTKGWKSGLVSGLGAGAADTLYGSIAGFSITFVIYFLIRQQFWIRLVGGALLILSVWPIISSGRSRSPNRKTTRQISPTLLRHSF